MASKVPATVITGFLGAGKTTLIRHMLENADGKRIALVINEFGDFGVDGEILRGCGDALCRDEDMIELSNGCICCTVADDFVPTMEKLLARDERPDHIVIETSGLALPQPLIQAFNWPEIRTQVTVDGVVTVVDGRAVSDGRFAHDAGALEAQRVADDELDHETPLSELFEDQIACADMIVVNKSDLLEDGGAALSAELKAEARDGVQVLRATKGALPVDVLLGQGVAAEADLGARHGHHHHHHEHDHEHADHHHDHDHDEFETFVTHLPEVADPVAFGETLGAVIREHDILRVKGFLTIEGKPMRLTLQAVGPRIDTYFDRPAGPERNSRLVVIGEAGMDRAAIEAALRP